MRKSTTFFLLVAAILVVYVGINALGVLRLQEQTKLEQAQAQHAQAEANLTQAETVYYLTRSVSTANTLMVVVILALAFVMSLMVVGAVMVAAVILNKRDERRERRLIEQPSSLVIPVQAKVYDDSYLY